MDNLDDIFEEVVHDALRPDEKPEYIGAQYHYKINVQYKYDYNANCVTLHNRILKCIRMLMMFYATDYKVESMRPGRLLIYDIEYNIQSHVTPKEFIWLLCALGDIALKHLDMMIIYRADNILNCPNEWVMNSYIISRINELCCNRQICLCQARLADRIKVDINMICNFMFGKKDADGSYYASFFKQPFYFELWKKLKNSGSTT
jgi:hypothetical protein